MKLWLKLLASFGLGVFVHHEAEEFKKTLHPRDPWYGHGIWSQAPDEPLMEHVEHAFPAIQPPGLEIRVADDNPVSDVVFIGVNPPPEGQPHDHGGRLPVLPPPPFPPELYVPATSQQRWDDSRFRTASAASAMYYRTP